MTKLFVKKLTNLDFSFLDAKRGLVGESWLIDVELTGELDAQGMVVDFGIVKKVLKDFINEYIDHCLLVPIQSEGCTLKEADTFLEIQFPLSNGESIHHKSPQQAVCQVDAEFINKSSIKELLRIKLKPLLPDNVTELNIRLYGEPHLREYYQYSHGLSQHQGNCQRIAHGHRSGLNIFIDGEESEQWRDYWIDRWTDIYLGCANHLVNLDSDYCEFNYQAPQGDFYLKLPKTMCYLIDSASTVENIAEHLAEEIAKKEKGKHVLVRAFEGIGKGAIAEVLGSGSEEIYLQR